MALGVSKLQNTASFFVHALIARPKTIARTIANLHSLEAQSFFTNTIREFAYWGEILRLQSIG
jgi:hypothetical protein